MDNSLRDRVLSSTDIVELIGESVSLTRKGKDFVGLCPFHDDHTPSMSVSPTKQIFKCWSCGVGGDALRFIQVRQGMDFREALLYLARRANIEIERQDPVKAIKRDGLREVLNWARGFFRRQLLSGVGEYARRYARERGLSDETMERFGLGLAIDSGTELANAGRRAGFPADLLIDAGVVGRSEKGRDYDRFRNRLMFPISDGQGRTIAFGGRTLGDDPAKYLNSPESPLFSKSRVLYALDAARDAIAKEREVIVVEGYMDAVLLHQAGVRNVVATLGTALTDAHMRLVKSLARRVVMCFDSDEAGRKAADRAVETALCHRVDVRVAVMPEGDDPADCVLTKGVEELMARLQTAVGALEFKWAGTLASFEGGTESRKRDAVSAFVAFIAKVVASGGIDPLEQGLLVGRLSALLSTPADGIYESLAAERRRIGTAQKPPAGDGSASCESSYEHSLHGLPAGLVSTAEELFGLALKAPQCFDRLDGSLAAVAGFNPAWRRLHRELVACVERTGAVDRSEVLEACDDAEICELVGRSLGRVRQHAVAEPMCDDVIARAAAELRGIRLQRLRSGLSDPDPAQSQDDAYRRMLELSRTHGGVLSAKHRILKRVGEGGPLVRPADRG
jgi:DNA primase